MVMCFLIWLIWFQNAWEQCCGVWEWIVMCVLRTLSFSVNAPQWPLEAWQGLSAQGCSVFLLDPPINSTGWRTDGSRVLFSGSVTSTFFTAVCKEAINIRSQHKYLSWKALSPSLQTVHSAAGEKTLGGWRDGPRQQAAHAPTSCCGSTQSYREFWECADVTDHSAMLICIKY